MGSTVFAVGSQALPPIPSTRVGKIRKNESDHSNIY